MHVPSVGRIVHFYDETGAGPIAAIVTLIHPDSAWAINLMVFQPNGGTAMHGPVLPRVAERTAFCWAWPPLVGTPIVTVPPELLSPDAPAAPEPAS